MSTCFYYSLLLLFLTLDKQSRLQYSARTGRGTAARSAEVFSGSNVCVSGVAPSRPFWLDRHHRKQVGAAGFSHGA